MSKLGAKELSEYLKSSNSEFNLTKLKSHRANEVKIVEIGDSSRGPAVMVFDEYGEDECVLICGRGFRDYIRTSLVQSVEKVNEKTWHVITLNSVYELKELE
jgi:hypothetical protein